MKKFTSCILSKANSLALRARMALSKPLFFGQACRIHQHQGLMPLFDSHTACRHT